MDQQLDLARDTQTDRQADTVGPPVRARGCRGGARGSASQICKGTKKPPTTANELATILQLVEPTGELV